MRGDMPFHYELMVFLCRANRLSIGLGYGDLRTLRRADNSRLDAAAVRGLDDVAAILCESGEGIGYLGSDPMEAEHKLYDLLVSHPWTWWINWTPHKLQQNAHKSWETRRRMQCRKKR